MTVLDSRSNVLFALPGASQNVPDYYGQVRRALATRRPVHTLVGDQLVVAEPIEISDRRYVVALTKRLDYVSSAVHVVQRAFIVAAAAGLLIALLLGLGLTSTLLRRLERLRDATRELERRGPDASPLPDDRGHDEVGELTRAFARMQARLRSQEAARRAFVATASHELRTPLASLDGMLELLRGRPQRRAPRPRGRPRAHRARPRAVAPALAAGLRPARPQPPRRRGGAAQRAAGARRAVPRGRRRVRAGRRRAPGHAARAPTRAALLGAGRPGGRRARRAHPARQRPARRAERIEYRRARRPARALGAGRPSTTAAPGCPSASAS